ncbi:MULTISPECIES: hyaluronate lyase N-terminal domain-containing protein [Paenibacillus]|uniref:hyaluronate lyase N-terminal domain-containing protein n=1 Tax=Paenibacillus TaxID=44249 RepID=UPI00096D5566|nr:hypothetical protein [Paenibacillus odorifer]OME18769.1 hypothetical protein BSK60_01645 [Paenibacillus odorifer]
MPVIKIKRGLAANVPALTLEAGELALATDTGKVYVGTGSGDKVMVNPDQAAAETAVKLKTARTIALAGDATGSTPFDGSANATITVVLPNLATAGTYTKLTINAKGQVISATQITAADIPMLTLSKISDAGTAASKNTGTAAGNVPLIGANGKLDDSILPALAISDTFVVASQAAMLALTAEVGDIAVRTDLNKTFILRLSGASTLANWQEILAPTAAVSSVAGKTGVVTLSASDVGLGNVTNESKATMFTNPSFTNPVVTTQATSDNSTKAASTAFVKAQGYLTASDTIDGGTF